MMCVCMYVCMYEKARVDQLHALLEEKEKAQTQVKALHEVCTHLCIYVDTSLSHHHHAHHAFSRTDGPTAGATTGGGQG